MIKEGWKADKKFKEFDSSQSKIEIVSCDL